MVILFDVFIVPVKNEFYNKRGAPTVSFSSKSLSCSGVIIFVNMVMVLSAPLALMIGLGPVP